MPVKKEKIEMPKQPAAERIKNFGEVALGYSEESARAEAERCLFCKNKPCVAGCPVSIDIPSFIKLIKEKKILEAYQKIKEENYLPAICGRVCPQESQCEIVCTMGKIGEPVAIGRLERFAADYAYLRKNSVLSASPSGKKSKKKVAIIGGGPAGLTAAGVLAGAGFAVTVFEALHLPGGVLAYGIPEFRLPKKIVAKEVENLAAMGVEFKYGYVIGRTRTLAQLFEGGFSAVFIGIGAGLPKFQNIPGENLNGVYSANEFLTRVNLMKAYKFPEYLTPVKEIKNAAVVGGGNVAMDASRCALRLGAENVYNIYRRTRKEMPAREEEIENAEEEGVKFNFLVNPVELTGDESGSVSKMKCVKMKLGAPDESGRRRPVEIPGEFVFFEVDTVIMAIGTSANPLLPSTVPELKLNKWGYIEVDPETGETSMENVYAGGDIVTGSATVISAMKAGKTAAYSIIKKLK
ncbi:MAG: NADPH-dependent glutamate synthase [Elusimicrobia bacterium]|nr:NADPH-dependent glutamate synthase [Elusimicrobiota bacterium]